MNIQEAKRRIEEARVSNYTELDLSRTGLNEIPEDVYELTFLKILRLSENTISNLSIEISNLVNLEVLELNFNTFVNLPEELFSLKNLKLLNLSGNHLRIIPEQISKLTKLEELHISNNEIFSLPTSFRRLKSLKTLFFRFGVIRVIPNEIFRLKNLETLYLSGNSLTELPTSIGKLTNLKELYLDSNKIGEIPHEIVNLVNLQVFDIRYNFHINIPAEILNDHKHAQKIINYFSKTQKGKARPLNEAKIVVVGEADFGKSLLIRRLIYNDYIDTKSTQGIKIERWKNVRINNENVQLNVWDFGGQEIMHSTHQFFFTKRTIYVLVINARQNEDKNKTEEWLKRIESFGGDSPVIVVGSKIDQNQRDENQIGQSYFQINESDLQSKFKHIKGFYGVCSDVRIKDYDNKWNEFKYGLITEIGKLSNLHQLFPADWFAIKDELEAMKEKNIPHISNHAYLTNCIQKEVKDEISQDTIREFLNDIGTVIYFKKLFNKMIFNPEWITNGVYALTDNPTVIQNQGVLKYSQLDEILTPKGYQPDEHKFILDLMKEFELCVEIEKEKRFLIPDLLLNVKEPYTGEWKNTLGFHYHYETYLKNIFTKFVVRMYRYIYQKTWWNNGVVLAHDDSKAYIKFDASDKKVIIRIDGDNIKKRQNLLAIIRKEFYEIHNDFASLEVAEFVAHPTITIKDKDERVKEILKDFDELISMEEDGEAEVYVKELRTKLPISDWLDGIETKEERHRKLKNFDNEETENIKPIESVLIPQTESKVELQNKIMKMEEELALLKKIKGNCDSAAKTTGKKKAHLTLASFVILAISILLVSIYYGFTFIGVIISFLLFLIPSLISNIRGKEWSFGKASEQMIETERQKNYEMANFEKSDFELKCHKLEELKLEIKALNK